MNFLGNNVAKLNEVIFENRNKNYGAYAIRSNYNNALFKSLSYLSSCIVLLFGILLINNRINNQIENTASIIFDDPSSENFIYSTPVNLTPIVEPIKKLESAAAKGSIATVIKDNAATTTSANISNSINGVGSNTATGTDPLSTTTNTVSSTSTNTVANTTTVIIADELPEFEGGFAGLMKYVSQNITYPTLAREINIEGVVYISCVVNELGDIENTKIMRGIGFGCDEEVTRVIKNMPRWKKVGKNAGHPVKVRFNIPVSFKLK